METTICDGPWRYTKTDWCGPWTARNTDTGEHHDTGVTGHVNNAREWVAANTATEPAPVATLPPGTWTIESGPKRARAGHQRYRGGEDRAAG